MARQMELAPAPACETAGDFGGWNGFAELEMIASREALRQVERLNVERENASARWIGGAGTLLAGLGLAAASGFYAAWMLIG